MFYYVYRSPVHSKSIKRPVVPFLDIYILMYRDKRPEATAHRNHNKIKSQEVIYYNHNVRRIFDVILYRESILP
jgi:hypothetical protein